MPTEKRQRKRQGREARLAEVRAQQAKDRLRSRIIAGVVVAGLIAFVAFLTSRGGGDDTVAAKGTTTTAVAGVSTTSPTTGSSTTGSPSTAAPKTTGATGCPAADGSAKPQTKFSAAPPMCIDAAKSYVAKVETDAGTFTVALDPKKAPKTVNNFVVLARYHYFDGLTFHRVIKDFVLQGGDPEGTGRGGPGYKFGDELPASVQEYKAGSLAMANAGPNTNGSQFFVVVSDAGGAKLSVPNYSLFGQVTDGMDVVKKIEADGGTGSEGTPAVVHKMTKVTITES